MRRRRRLARWWQHLPWSPRLRPLRSPPRLRPRLLRLLPLRGQDRFSSGCCGRPLLPPHRRLRRCPPLVAPTSPPSCCGSSGDDGSCCREPPLVGPIAASVAAAAMATVAAGLTSVRRCGAGPLSGTIQPPPVDLGGIGGGGIGICSSGSGDSSCRALPCTGGVQRLHSAPLFVSAHSSALGGRPAGSPAGSSCTTSKAPSGAPRRPSSSTAVWAPALASAGSKPPPVHHTRGPLSAGPPTRGAASAAQNLPCRARGCVVLPHPRAVHPGTGNVLPPSQAQMPCADVCPPPHLVTTAPLPCGGGGVGGASCGSDGGGSSSSNSRGTPPRAVFTAVEFGGSPGAGLTHETLKPPPEDDGKGLAAFLAPPAQQALLQDVRSALGKMGLLSGLGPLFDDCSQLEAFTGALQCRCSAHGGALTLSDVEHVLAALAQSPAVATAPPSVCAHGSAFGGELHPTPPSPPHPQAVGLGVGSSGDDGGGSGSNSSWATDRATLVRPPTICPAAVAEPPSECAQYSALGAGGHPISASASRRRRRPRCAPEPLLGASTAPSSSGASLFRKGNARSA